MVTILTPSSSDVIDPEELLDWAIDNVDPMDDESMLAASERLCALYNNRDFIINKTIEQMCALASGEGNSASAQGTVYGTRSGPKGGFSVRSVVWTPPLTKDIRSRKLQDRTLSFSLPHDHNFSLLTIGYHGPGYKTEVYEYNKNEVVGYPGETVSLKYLGNSNLEKGSIIYFRPSKDVHVQYHPEQISISLNLIGQPNDVHLIPQYEFDIEQSKIKKLLSGNSVQNMLLPFEMAIALGWDQNIADVVNELSKTHPSEYIRAASYRVLLKVSPVGGLKFAEEALSDKSSLVRGIAAGAFTLK